MQGTKGGGVDVGVVASGYREQNGVERMSGQGEKQMQGTKGRGANVGEKESDGLPAVTISPAKYTKPSS